MELVVSTSILAAFFAGMAALFAPCCISILLPSYFASIFRQKSKVILMTLVYFAGLLVIFLPLGLATVSLASLFSRYHALIFALSGFFLMLLGGFLIAGKHWRLPFKIHPVMKGRGLGSVFGLGVVSGLATTCCAPVLAGVVAMSALPGSVVLAEVYTLVFVFGMVAPLFVMAALIDRTELMSKFQKINRPVSFKLGRWQLQNHLANLIVGVAYLALGVMVLSQFRNDTITTHSNFQVALNVQLTGILRTVDRLVGWVPQWVWAALFLAIVMLITRAALRPERKVNHGSS